MASGSKQLLNQCLKCGMKYDSAEQLATHQKKFCIGGDMGELDHLEKKLKDSTKVDNIGIANNNTAGTKKNDFDALYMKSVQDREKDMQAEIDKLKLDKANLRAKKQQEEDALADLIRETELKKERDLRARIERDQIRKEIGNLEKAKLTSLEQEKKTQLEKLASDREQLRQKEDHLMKEIERLEKDMRTMDRIRDEDIKKQDDILDKLKKKNGENTQVNALLLEEKSDRIAQLRAKRENLEFERQKIMGNLDKIRSGDMSSLRKSNYGVFSANQMLGDMNQVKNYGAPDLREKIRQDELRLQQLKNDHNNVVSKDHVYADYAYASPPTNPGVTTIPRQNSAPRNIDRQPLGMDRSSQNSQSMMFNQPATSPYNRLQDIYDQSTAVNSPDISQKIPPEFQKLLYDKELEKEKAKHELEIMKLQTAIKPDNAANNNLTLKDMQLKFNGLGGSNAPNNGFNIYGNNKEFFIQNEARSVDLNEDERFLLNIQAQEVDALRLLSQLPVGTDLYRFKLEQYKELSTTRAEAEKIVQEQRLLKIRRDFEKQRREEDRKFENEKWIDEQRKNVIMSKIRKEGQPTSTERKYDPLEGFVVHWDYCLGIPKRNDSCQMVFGIYINGDEVCPAKLIEPHPCEVDTAVSNRCIFGNSLPVNDVPANSNALLIFEVQTFPSKDSTNPRLISFGWSQLDLFDSRRELRRGKFKVPIYECPTNPNIDIDGIRNLAPVNEGASWAYIRISYPDDLEFGRAQTLYPESTHMEYVIPQIHLRSFRPPGEAQFSQEPQPNMYNSMPIDPYKKPQSQPYMQQRQIPTDNDSFSQQKHRAQVSQHSLDRYQPQEPRLLNQSAKLPDFSTIDQSQTMQPKKALQIVIHALRNHVARNHLRISCALLQDAQMVADELGQNCVFNTNVHNPFENAKNSSTDPLDNKALGNKINFNEKAKFLLDLGNLVAKNKGQKDYYLMFQVLEKPEPFMSQMNSQTMSNKMSQYSRSFGKLEYDLFGWLLFKVNKSDGRLYTGKFIKNLFSSPLRKPPFDLSKEKKSDCEIEFSINEIEWENNSDNDGSDDDDDDDDDDNNDSGTILQKKNKGSKYSRPSPQQGGKNKPSPNDMKPKENKNLAYIPNMKILYQDKPFEKKMGIDFYFDGCRLLPDNVTVTKVIVQIVDVDFNSINIESDIPELDSTCYNPLFDWKMEIRPANLIPTAIAFITLMTIDKISNQQKIIGYSGINLFLNRATKKPPTLNTETNIGLLNGCYQLPIYCQEPSRVRPFTLDNMERLERIPTASILVRITQAPQSEKGDILNLSDFPNKKDWETKGVKIPRPSYGSGAYSTIFYNLGDLEKELSNIRLNRQDVLVREAIQNFLKANNLNKTKDVELQTWIDEKMPINPGVGILDTIYFNKYYPEIGFKFALDGIHNAPSGQPYIGIYVPNPPGGRYTGQADLGPTQLISMLDWEGPLLSPKFLNGFSIFNNIPFQENAHFIVEIKTINLSKKVPQSTTVGWTIVPLFTPNGYLLSGLYQIPLIAGDVNKEIVTNIANAPGDPWNFILQQIGQKKPVIKWLPNTSVVVRLLDCQKEGHLEQPWDYNRVDTRYLPNIQKYVYNANAASKAQQGKALKTIVPRKEDIQAYQQKLTDFFIQELGFQ